MRSSCAGFALLITVFVSFHAHTARIVSLAPVATEFLFELGLGPEVVGVTTYCDKPKQAKGIAKIGGFTDPQLESILKLRPNLVVATPFGSAVQVVATLKAKGIKVVSEQVETLDDMKRFLAALGSATNKKSQATALRERLDASYAEFKNRLPKGLKVLILISPSPLIAAGPGTFGGQILTHLGAQNVLVRNSPAWPIVSLEELMRAPPEVIVVSSGKPTLEAARASLKPLLLAHPRIRIFAPEDTILQRPGPFLIDDLKALVAGLTQNG